jgi:glucokinase
VEGEHVSASAIAAEPDGLAIVHEYAAIVARGIAGLANILDPEVVVVSGGLVDVGDILLDPIRNAFAGHLEGGPHRPEVPIVAAALGSAAGVVGAAVMARGAVVPGPDRMGEGA